ncbi:1-acyl-sn-glycerol-3-phosphate acyltransferase [Verrucomicrobium sp. GAS474]|uniref:lysophospholipid acyltransferase family protein n=1 Tax=Verrucomicrobium sp. GAS474 TaxID=1882831 RepID=UPI00087B7CC9|nr:lysophospholipid acyltransferase family protein [Verrucomicrobium sp. GAS474]SDT97629.1 1-acyl-sn-glycerol-3-phosphate acyltransferase [Verrucomicrobium sp. GAS474]
MTPRRFLRMAWRLLRIGLSLAYSAADHLLTCAFRPPADKAQARARWLRRTSRRLLPHFRLRVEVVGTPPRPRHDRQGLLLVSNHLGYLDIPLLASLHPVIFVAKKEVAAWPVFGWFARQAGTLFVNRERRTRTGHTVNEIESALQNGHTVILFPEGTSSGGENVLPFKAPLLQPALRNSPPLAVAAIRYRLPPGEGDPAEEVSYWKEMTLFPHLLNLLTKPSIEATVTFSHVPSAQEGEDRKDLALRLHAEAARLHAGEVRAAALTEAA